jgi:transcriptional regulator with XRE-family HTH domain
MPNNTHQGTINMNLKDIIQKGIIKAGLTQGELSKRTGVPQPSISRAKRGGSIGVDNLSKILSFLGARIVLPEEMPDHYLSTSTVSFNFEHADKKNRGLPSVDADHYVALPVVTKTDQIDLPNNAPDRWIILYKKNHAHLYSDKHLVAVQIGMTDYAMDPTLSPSDVVIIDLEDKKPVNGSLFLFRQPKDHANFYIRRLYFKHTDTDMELFFIPDNKDKQVFQCDHAQLGSDYVGKINRVILGKCVAVFGSLGNK